MKARTNTLQKCHWIFKMFIRKCGNKNKGKLLDPF